MARLVLETGGGAEAKRTLDQIRQAIQGVAGATEVLEKSQSKLDRQNRTIQRQFDSLARSLDPVIKREKDLERATRTLDRAFRAGIVTQAEHNRLLGLAQQRFSGVTNAAQTAATRMPAFLAAAFSLATVQRFVQSLLDAELKLVGFRKRLTVAFGGNEEAGAAGYQFAVSEAKRLGLALENVAAGYSRIAVSGNAAGFTSAQNEKTFSAVAEASAALSLSGSDTERVLIAVEQMMSKGKVSAEELRRQMGNALPGAFQIAARAMGMTTQELDKMVSTGNLLATDFIPKFAAQLHKELGEEAKKNVNQLTGAVNNLKTAWFELKTTIAEAGIGDAIKGAANDTAKAAGEWSKSIKKGNEEAQSAGFKNLWQAVTFLINPATFVDVAKQAGSAINRSASTLRIPGVVDTSGVVVPPQATASAADYSADLAKLRSAYAALVDPETAAKEAQDAWVKSQMDAMDASDKLAEKLRKEREEARASVEAWGNATIGSLDVKNPLQAYLSNQPELDRMLQLLGGANSETAKWVAMLDRVQNHWQEIGLTQEQANALLPIIRQNIGSIETGTEDATDEAKKLTEEWQKFRDQTSENFIRGVQGAFSDFFYGLLDGGSNAFADFAKSLKDVLFRTLAEYLAQWAVTQAKMLALSLARIAKEKAAQKAGGGGGTGDASSYASVLSKTGWFGVAAAAVVGLAAFVKHRNDQARNRTYDTEAQVNFGSFGLSGGYLGGLSQTANAVSKGIIDVLKAMQEASGAYITGMDQIVVQIRHDKKGFMVGQEIFGSMQEAIIAAAKKAFLSSTLSGQLEPEIQKVIEGFRGTDPEKLIEAVKYVRQIVDEASGFSDIEITLRGLPEKIAAVKQQLMDFGLQASDAFALAAKWGAQQFVNLRRQITGEKETPAQELARRKAEAALYNAQLAMYRAELTARKAYLEGQLKLAQGQGQIHRAELENWKGYLSGRQEAAKANAEIMQAELNAINAALQALAGLDINLGTIKLSGGGNIGNGLKGLNDKARRIKDVLEEMRDLQKDLATSQLNPGGLASQFAAAQSEFFRLKNLIDTGKIQDAAGISDAVKKYLELYGQLYGTAGSGYAGIYDQIMQWLQGVTGANDNKKDDSVKLKRSGTEQSPFAITSKHLEKAGANTDSNTQKLVSLNNALIAEIKGLRNDVRGGGGGGGSYGRTKTKNAMPGAA